MRLFQSSLDDNPRGEILPSPVITTLFDKII
jgi:hypothetical protein